jgi:hypothetical protein
MRPQDIHLGGIYSDGREERFVAAQTVTAPVGLCWFPWRGAICGPPQTSSLVSFAAWAQAELVPPKVARMKRRKLNDCGRRSALRER